MATLEDEIRDLREKNNELVQKVQYWKMAAASKENEKLELMKEINELRLKLSRLRSGGAAEARKLDAALQTASEEALSHLVQASSAVARTIELAKTYMQDRQEIDNLSPRWSNISGTPNTERVHRVPPMLMGGQSIQPVVSLSRTILNTSLRSVSRSPNRSRNVTERAVPLHMLQDVYIPLTRIDADVPGNNMDTESDVNEADDSTEDLGFDDSMERSIEGAQDMSEGDDFEASRRLEAVTEDLEPEEETITPPRRAENPLEGPSWLLDRPSSTKSTLRLPRSRTNLEPDSTTEFDDGARCSPAITSQRIDEEHRAALSASSMAAACFSPTVRRRKRSATPPPAPRAALPTHAPTHEPTHAPTPTHTHPRARSHSNSGRVLKVLVAKMSLGDDDEDASPPKRSLRDSPRFDAPSPNGATDAAVIVSEHTSMSECVSVDVAAARRARRTNSGRQETPTAAHSTVNKDNFTDQNRTGNQDDRLSHLVGSESRDIEAGHSRTGNVNLEYSQDDSREAGYSLGYSREAGYSLGYSRGASADSDSGGEAQAEGRTRRPRKAVTYKERPLNRKMRR